MGAKALPSPRRGGGDLTDDAFTEWINSGGTPTNRTNANRMYRLGLLARNGEVTATTPPDWIGGEMGELLTNVLAAHPDPLYLESTRSTREWAYRLRLRGWPVRHTKWGGGGYYLAVPVESGWRVVK